MTIEQLRAAYYEGIRVCAETTDDDGSGWDDAGLRAVEAAVRAEDAGLAHAVGQDCPYTGPDALDGWAGAAEKIAVTIRAQMGGE